MPATLFFSQRRTSLWLLAATALVGCVIGFAHADDLTPPCTAKACSKSASTLECPAEAATSHEHGVPFFTKLPYVIKLFKNVSGESFERIGVDFDFAIDSCDAPVSTKQCQIAAGKCTAPKCQTETCSSSKCDNASCDVAKCSTPHKKSGRLTAGVSSKTSDCGGKCCSCPPQNMAKLKAKIARLKAREEHFPRDAAIEMLTENARLKGREELLDGMIDMITENAKLKAQVEFAADREEMLGSMLELSTENARLTAQVEFAASKEKLLSAVAELSARNAHLAAQVQLTEQLHVQNARLQQQLAVLSASRSGEVAQTAARAVPTPSEPHRPALGWSQFWRAEQAPASTCLQCAPAQTASRPVFTLDSQPAVPNDPRSLVPPAPYEPATAPPAPADYAP